MGLAIDTIATSALNPSSTVTATTAVTGDSLAVRNASITSAIYLEQVIRGGASSGVAGVRSPLFHDNVRGFRFNTAQVISVYDVPQEAYQPLHAADVLIAEVTGGAAETDVVALSVYYSDLPGAAARLHLWSEIQPLIRNLKSIQVAVAATGAAATWTDTVITTTENLTKAKTDYAVLGFMTDLATTVIGVKGPDTANLRICGAGVTDASDTSDYFVRQSIYTQRPYIPVFSGDNRSATFVSTLHHGATQAPNITLVLAELSQQLPN